MRPKAISDLELFAHRMKAVVERAGGAKALSEKTKIPRRTIGTYLAAEADPSRKNLVEIARHADVNIVWLATGHGPMTDEYVAVPYYPLKKEAESGRILEPRGEDELPHIFKKSWINSVLRTDPRNLSFVEIDDPDMETTLQLQVGQIVLVDESKTSILKDGLYLISFGGSYTVTRLRRISGNTIEILSNDPSFRPYIALEIGEGTYEPVALKELDIVKKDKDAIRQRSRTKILGKVVWSGKRL